MVRENLLSFEQAHPFFSLISLPFLDPLLLTLGDDSSFSLKGHGLLKEGLWGHETIGV